MTRLCQLVCLTVLYVKVACGEENDGQRIANKFGEDLSFASKQIIRGFTAIFGPVLDTLNGPQYAAEEGGMHNIRRVILRDGINAIGKGAKAGATIISAPARVAGTGLEEARKASQAGLGNAGLPQHPKSGDTRAIDDGAKLISNLLNTTSSELSQANLGAVLLESALKTRIKDIGNKTTSYMESRRPRPPQDLESKHVDDDAPIKKREDEVTTKSSVDDLIEKFNEAVKQNDERLLKALKVVLSSINPPKD